VKQLIYIGGNMGKINFNTNDIKSYAENSITYNRGAKYYNENMVVELSRQKIQNKPEDGYTTRYSALVKGKSYSSYNTTVILNDNGDITDFDCDCPTFSENMGSCKHIVAVMLKIYYNSHPKIISYGDIVFKKNINQPKKHNFPLEDLINVFENKIKEKVESDQKKGYVSLKPILVLSGKEDIGIEFKIGSKRHYVVKDAYELAYNIQNKVNVVYGKSLEFDHDLSGFETFSKPLAVFLRDEAETYMQIVKKTSGLFSAGSITGRTFKIFPFSFDSFFNLFKDQTIECRGYKYAFNTLMFLEEDPETEFYINEEASGKYSFSTNLYICFETSSKNHTYIIAENKLYKCSKEFTDTILPAVNKIMIQPAKEITLTEEYMGKFCSAVLPQISKYALVKTDPKISGNLNTAPLSPSIYLDCNNRGHIYASVIFNYGDILINPFRKSPKDNCVIRNLLDETKILVALENAGFKKNTVKYALTDENKIYEFLTSGISRLTSLCEINISDDFRKINIKYPKAMSMGIKLNGNLIEIDMSKPEFDLSELKDILLSYKIKKKYYRLKDGSLLNLDNEYFNTLKKLVEDFDVTENELESFHIETPKYRSLYLDSLVKNNEWIHVNKSHDFKKMIRGINESSESDFEPPVKLKTILRNYQVTGFRWLKSLSEYSLGGILADDMGLGKTLQIISLLLSDNSGKPSIVVCPTSLIYNWKNEIEKFSPNISTLIISGPSSERCSLIKSANSYNLVLTSYDLIKRDIGYYEPFEFKYCILDEAQYIKNPSTQNARTVKMINSEVRFALTGTPIENSLADLWSIFDFIMPGYLLSYKKFKDKYEIPIVKDNNDDMLQRLNNQVRPFILRRLKKDVLKELPDKIETVTYAQMEKIQKKLYTAELMKLNKEFREEISERGYKKSQIKILSMLTRLRQICCDPSLCYDNYNGGSAKLELCMEIIKNSIDNNHKILIFSQFTSMLRIIEKELKKNDIGYFILTGATKSIERIQLTKKFNSDKTPVFLISLKAGGTGLNLTGADVVIHYDPWWNISAQNQATDRTHRIGQNNKVQVFKLIAKNTIEEKIEKLQQNKKDLADSVIKKGEILINSLTNDEIDNLFKI
jgi:SNF2 family DNA or RNA helicase